MKEQDPKVLEECKQLCKDHLIGKKTNDFLMLDPTSRHFLFTTRVRYLNNLENPDSPFFFSPKQLKYMKDLIAQVSMDGGESKKIEVAVAESVRRIREKLSKALSEETALLKEELGLSNRKMLRLKLENELKDFLNRT